MVPLPPVKYSSSCGLTVRLATSTVRNIRGREKVGSFLVSLWLDVGQVALDGLEGEAEEVSPDLLEAVHGEAGVTPVVKELDVTGTGLLVMRHHLNIKI